MAHFILRYLPVHMLLGSTNPHQQHHTEEAFIAQLISQQRYAEAYTLLLREQQDRVVTWYNLALCHHWSEGYQQAINCLDRAASLLPAGKGTQPHPADSFQFIIRTKQNELDDHLQPITAKYADAFNPLVNDAIIRLKTDCWLSLGNYARVVETATRIAHKNYKNIADALQTAKNKLNL